MRPKRREKGRLFMRQMIETQFGTARGAVRLALSYFEVGSGLDAQRRADLAKVQRFVFVCHGNICRSAYAHVLAQELGLNVASFGLSTSTDSPAHKPIIEEAAKRGVDLSRHRSTAKEDFVAMPGDYFLAMETRHLRKLAKKEKLQDLPRALLGTFASPPFPHIHDPYKISPAYLPTCLDRIEIAVSRLAASKDCSLLKGSARRQRTMR